MPYVAPQLYSHKEAITIGKLNQLTGNDPAIYTRNRHTTASGSNTATWTVNNSAGSWQSDTSGLSVTLSLAEKSTVIVSIAVRWQATAIADEAMAFRVENVTDSTYSTTTFAYAGEPNADCARNALVVGVFANVNAGNKVFRLGGSRVSSDVTVTVTSRYIVAHAWSTA